MIINKKTRSKKAIIVGAVIALFLFIGGYLSVAALNNLPPFSSVDTSDTDEHKINLERSQTEKDAIKSLQEDPELKTQNNQTDVPATPGQASDGRLEANVLVTNVGISNGTVSASGFVTNLTEDGGTCVFTFTNGSNKLEKSSPTLVNSTSTTCQTIRFSESELEASGKWDVTITYDSSSAYGVSAKTGFTK